MERGLEFPQERPDMTNDPDRMPVTCRQRVRIPIGRDRRDARVVSTPRGRHFGWSGTQVRSHGAERRVFETSRSVVFQL